MPSPNAQRPPAEGPAGAGEVTGEDDRGQGTAAADWLAGELATVVDILHAARLTAKAGRLPVVHVRRAAVRLVALDAAVADDLALVGAMRADPEAVQS